MISEKTSKEMTWYPKCVMCGPRTISYMIRFLSTRRKRGSRKFCQGVQRVCKRFFFVIIFYIRTPISFRKPIPSRQSTPPSARQRNAIFNGVSLVGRWWHGFSRGTGPNSSPLWIDACGGRYPVHTSWKCPVAYLQHNMSRDMWFQTMWHFDSVDSDEPVQPPFKLRNSK